MRLPGPKATGEDWLAIPELVLALRVFFDSIEGDPHALFRAEILP